ncbi:hypothetical protein BB347_18465 (plasmid) [Natronorubrum daqingense]|nr:hypothetical protein BB347_18465 [Natronorubrum daqingense]
MANEFNANTDAWLSYGNWLLEEAGVTAAGSATVAVEVGISRIPFRDVEDAVETHITTEYDSDAGEFNDLEWVDEPTDDADFEVALHNLAAENGDGELFEFRSEYIDTDGDHELPDDAYLNRLAGKYGGVVGVGEESMTVFDILLGGVNR